MSYLAIFLNAAGVGLCFWLICHRLSQKKFGSAGYYAFVLILNLVGIALVLIKIAGERQ